MNKESSQADTEKITYNGVEITNDQVISETFDEHFITFGEKLTTGIKQISTSLSDYLVKLNLGVKSPRSD